jgi:hypothetical protein
MLSARDQNNGYAGLDGAGQVNRPVKTLRVGSDPGSPASGDVWINGGALKYRDATGTPATQTVEMLSARDQNNGYAGLDGAGQVNRPAKTIRVGADPGSPNPGDVWVNGVDLKWRDNGGTPVTKVAVFSTRAINPGVGLGGGGDLTQDRTLRISAFTGMVAKDVDPPSLTWSGSEVKVHLSVDVGPDGQVLPVAVRLPATVDAALSTELVLEFDDASNKVVSNMSTSTALDASMQDLLLAVMGDLGSAATANGRCIRKLHLQTRNTTGSTVSSIDIGVFRLRALASPRGGGTPL